MLGLVVIVRCGFVLGVVGVRRESRGGVSHRPKGKVQCPQPPLRVGLTPTALPEGEGAASAAFACGVELRYGSSTGGRRRACAGTTGGAPSPAAVASASPPGEAGGRAALGYSVGSGAPLGRGASTVPLPTLERRTLRQAQGERAASRVSLRRQPTGGVTLTLTLTQRERGQELCPHPSPLQEGEGGRHRRFCLRRQASMLLASFDFFLPLATVTMSAMTA